MYPRNKIKDKINIAYFLTTYIPVPTFGPPYTARNSITIIEHLYHYLVFTIDCPSQLFTQETSKNFTTKRYYSRKIMFSITAQSLDPEDMKYEIRFLTLLDLSLFLNI